MSPAWRWRRCPRCGGVERASDYRCIEPYQGWGYGAVERECPRCGYVAQTAEFYVVRERHAATYHGGTAVYS